MSGIVYYTLWKNYNEIMALAQEYKSSKMTNYSVLVRDIPESLAGTSFRHIILSTLFCTTGNATFVWACAASQGVSGVRGEEVSGVRGEEVSGVSGPVYNHGAKVAKPPSPL